MYQRRSAVLLPHEGREPGMGRARPEQRFGSARGQVRGTGAAGPPTGGGIMHPMFVTLFLETDDDDLQAEEEAKRRAALRRKQPAMVVRAAARGRG